MCVLVFNYFAFFNVSHSQSPAVSGTVNITFDAWQAGNSDGYFAVTGHWIEEDKPREWELKSALLGFTMVTIPTMGFGWVKSFSKSRNGLIFRTRYIYPIFTLRFIDF
jgi:hypothetical protein